MADAEEQLGNIEIIQDMLDDNFSFLIESPEKSVKLLTYLDIIKNQEQFNVVQALATLRPKKIKLSFESLNIQDYLKPLMSFSGLDAVAY